jgi:hypothetical protein
MSIAERNTNADAGVEVKPFDVNFKLDWPKN